jgi:hypothetical protein
MDFQNRRNVESRTGESAKDRLQSLFIVITRGWFKIGSRDNSSMPPIPVFIRYGWALPATLIGVALILLTLMSGGRAKVHSGVWEASGGWPGRRLACGLPFAGPIAAITLGHVVLGDCEQSLLATREHEREHVRQFERWGILFFPVYALAGVRAWLKGGDPYRDNAFEVAARKAEISNRSGG